MRRLLLIFIFLYGSMALAQSSDGWMLFDKVKFNSKFFKEYKEHFLVPTFDSKIRSLEGTEVTLRGHYLPMDLESDRVILLSKYPYSQCFFCGGAGPESVAEIVFPSKHPKLKADQIITVVGKLQLNDADVNHLNFILKDAALIAK
jgi:hypothetical protein